MQQTKDKKSYKKLEDFNQKHEEAIALIHSYVDNPEDYPEMYELAVWLLETKHHPSNYLTEKDSEFTDYAQGFAGLLDNIYNAVYDDGSLTFVTVNGAPRIVFYEEWEDNFESIVLSRREKQWNIDLDRHIGLGKLKPYEISVIDIQPNEFGKLYDEYNTKLDKSWLRIDFLRTQYKEGLDVAIEKFKGHPLYDLEFFTNTTLGA